jgi:uncharacterized delta-60 repeat protein
MPNARVTLLAASTLALFLMLLPPPSEAGYYGLGSVWRRVSGFLDRNLGTHGVLAFSINDTEQHWPADALSQSSGRIVTAVNLESATTRTVLSGFNPNGTLDTAFGSSGSTSLTYPGATETWSRRLILGPGETIYVSLSVNVSGNWAGGFAKLSANGALDTAFGSSGFVLLSHLSGNNLYALQVQANGVILGVTQTWDANQYFNLVRYTAAGVLDTTFGTSGYTAANVSWNYTPDLAAINSSDGTALVGGIYDNGGVANWFVCKLSAAGALVGAFGASGCRTFVVDPTALVSGYNVIKEIGIQSTGRILLAGSNDNSGGTLAALTSAGVLDTTFSGGTGVLTDTTLLVDDGFWGMLLGGDDSIYLTLDATISGSSIARTAIMKLHPNGSLNTSFGNSGTAWADIHSTEAEQGAEKAHFDASSNVVVVGQIALGTNWDLSLARFTR